MTQDGILSTKQQEELLKSHLENERKLANVHDNQRKQQISVLQDRMAERRKRKLSKLQDQHEAELSDVRANIVVSNWHGTSHVLMHRRTEILLNQNNYWAF